ncbi:MAG: hypothetical protein A4E73_02278 [Syntrophaceae bacterium PtaU1.Bin231]|nr:MAG: hypothetical protein A4E73_02278 [Syntrophaceae bacterium PtaU1.Bin231]
MDIQILSGIQIVADIVLCAAIIVLLRRSTAAVKERGGGVEQNLKQLRDMLNESQQAASRFLESVEESRRSLKGLFFQLEEKERKLKELLQTGASDSGPGAPAARAAGGPAAMSSDRYGEVIALHRRGLSGSDIARQSGIPEGEISLILDLERARGDSLARDQKVAGS